MLVGKLVGFLVGAAVKVGTDVADGVIVGSAVVRCIEQAQGKSSVSENAGDFVRQLVEACRVS